MGVRKPGEHLLVTISHTKDNPCSVRWAIDHFQRKNSEHAGLEMIKTPWKSVGINTEIQFDITNSDKGLSPSFADEPHRYPPNDTRTARQTPRRSRPVQYPHDWARTGYDDESQ